MGKREPVAQEPCRACIGTGRVKVYRHRLSNRKFGAMAQGYRAYRCPACDGAGVLPVRALAGVAA